MRVLIFTSSGGTAHDAAAYALQDWLTIYRPEACVKVEHILENASIVTRAGVRFYNWIQRNQPWLHQVYWRAMELEDLIKPGRPLFGRQYMIQTLKDFKPDVLVSTHPHINRGHFDTAKRVLGPNIRTVTCNTELDGGFGFSRNWISNAADLHWVITDDAKQEVAKRHLFIRSYPANRIHVLGPLLYPDFHRNASAPTRLSKIPKLVLASGSNGANNHVKLLDGLLYFGSQIEIVVLCGRRLGVLRDIQSWISQHPHMKVSALGFQKPKEMADLYRTTWAHVARPGARTATEALFMGCPLIFNRIGSTMPQELLATRYFRNRGLELSVRRPHELGEIVGSWIDEPSRYHELRNHYNDHRLHANATNIIGTVFSEDGIGTRRPESK